MALQLEGIASVLAVMAFSFELLKINAKMRLQFRSYSLPLSQYLLFCIYYFCYPLLRWFGASDPLSWRPLASLVAGYPGV